MRITRGRDADPFAVLADLGARRINYDRGEVARPDWNFDRHRHVLGFEEPGPPTESGLWSRARALVRDYEFTPPELINAHYRSGTDLAERNMLLEGRFLGLRFLMGVRITALLDERGEERTAWGWSYDTLDGHLERGRVDYAVVKHHSTGEVEFTATSYSQVSPALHPVLRMGWAVFGRRTQLRFYRRIGERLEDLLRYPADAVTVPRRRPVARGWNLTIIDAASG
ncbi:DUF1990 family protein [Amycolatopsis sp. QT-25]|uniref:DUF1990 family protein n=1 Tax=Amycolatopsis sp. QT-25 TaxID=3034022 RepID=UPI0023EC549B|nr:DUF1990 family protein [Amycolatopsis sp. QT-25]WET76824.1 DUF1990 family protein [Amycolatopsis sp. QT-25]